jgi:hypothetical protein
MRRRRCLDLKSAIHPKTAKTPRLTIRQSPLLRADEVIQ